MGLSRRPAWGMGHDDSDPTMFELDQFTVDLGLTNEFDKIRDTLSGTSVAELTELQGLLSQALGIMRPRATCGWSEGTKRKDWGLHAGFLDRVAGFIEAELAEAA